MPRVSIVTPDKARGAAVLPGMAGSGRLSAYLDGAKDPIHLHLARLGLGEDLAIGPLAVDCAAYVWQGEAAAGGVALAAGSSAIVEHGAAAVLTCAADEALVLLFTAAAPQSGARPGGHVHLLPAGRVPRMEPAPGAGGVSGGLHADSACPTCEVWLHENHFPAAMELTPEQIANGVHSHTEDEIIFVTGGEIRLGAKLCGPGTALAIAADTLYGFTAGPQGLSFVNFRAGMPGDISFAHGAKISETGYWRERVPRPEYLSPVAA